MAGYLGIGEERDPLAGIKALLGGFVPEQWRGREGPTVLPTGAGGMVPSPVNPEAIRTFTERVNPPGTLTGNIGNLPPGDFLRMLYNPDITAAAVQPTGATPSATVPPQSPEDLIRKLTGEYAKTAAAENEWLAERQLLGASGPGGMTQKDVEAGRQARRGPLPWDIFANMPEVPGKTFVGGWVDPSGKFQPLFEPKKSAGADFMGTVQPLLDDYSRRLTEMRNMPTGGGREESIQRSRQMHMFDAYTKGFNAVMEKVLLAGKAPSEIDKAISEATKNIAEARRVQVAPNVYVGPGEMGSFAIPPGGQPQQFAMGGPETKASLAESTLFAKLIPGLAQEALKASLDITQLPEGRAEAQRLLTGLLGMAGAQAPQPTGKPSKEQWLAAAKKANPGRSDQELLKYYQQHYGR